MINTEAYEIADNIFLSMDDIVPKTLDEARDYIRNRGTDLSETQLDNVAEALLWIIKECSDEDT